MSTKQYALSDKNINDLTDFIDYWLDYMINESHCPDEYENEIEKGIDSLRALGFVDDAEAWKEIFEESMETWS